MAEQETTGGLSKITKMAVLLESLDHKEAVNILKSLSSDAMISLISALRNLPAVTAEQQNEIIREFSIYIENINLARGGDEVAQRLLEEVVGKEKADEFLGKTVPFAFLRGMEDAHIGQLLNEEQPAITAIILASLPAEKAANIINNLDPVKRSAVVKALVDKRQAEPGVLQRLEHVIQKKIGGKGVSNIRKEKETMGGPTFLAEVCQNLGQETEEEILSTVEEKSEKIAQQVRDLLFTFADIARLKNSDLQHVLREVSADEIALALKQSPEEVEKKIVGNMSKSAKENLDEERELMGKVKLSEVHAAQEKIVSVVRELKSQEKITIEKESDDDVYV